MSRTHYIYLAGPIAGCDKGEANDWRHTLREQLPENIEGVSPLRCEPIIGERYGLEYDDPRFGTPKAISAKNYYDTVTCDMVLAYLPKELNERRPSYGTTIEIGWAIGLRKPLVVITDDPYLAGHPLIKANADWVFDNFEDALDISMGSFQSTLTVRRLHVMTEEWHGAETGRFPNTTPNVMSGKKFDGGKPPIGLIPKSALVAEAEVLAFGAQKYDRHNWRGGMEWSRLVDAAFRHILAFNAGEDVDPETGISHLAHARCCLGFLIEYQAEDLGDDDRYKAQRD